MNISFIRLKGLIAEIRLLRSEVSRLADLKEIELQSVHHLTTRIIPATAADLKQTQVAYTDPEYEELVRLMERRAGRPLTEEESQRVLDLLSVELVESE